MCVRMCVRVCVVCGVYVARCVCVGGWLGIVLYRDADWNFQMTVD